MLQENQVSFSYCIGRQLQLLNIRREQSLQNIHKLENMILTVKKNKVKADDLRLFLLGDSNVLGVLPLLMSSTNQLVCQGYLEVLRSILTLEKCSFSDNFKKLLDPLPPTALKFTTIFLDCQCFLPNYYFLIKKYI